MKIKLGTVYYIIIDNYLIFIILHTIVMYLVNLMHI